jgi:transcription initiation factor TFIIB
MDTSNGDHKNEQAMRVANSMKLEGLINPEIPGCPDCKDSGDVIEDYAHGNYVCRNCGLIVGDPIISDGTEWRTFEQDNSSKQDMNRVGDRENELLSQFGLSTVIGDAGRTGLSKTQNRGAMTQAHRNLLAGFKKIETIAGTFQLPMTIIDRAKELYKRVEDSKEIKKKGDAVVAACVFIACKQEKVARTIKEMCAVADVRMKDLSRCFTKIKALKLYKKPGGKIAGASASEQIMARFASTLKLSHAITKAAVFIVQKAQELGLGSGKKPATLSGAALYLACALSNEKKSVDDISKVCGMSTSTIRKCYLEDFFPRRIELVDPTYASKYTVASLSSDIPMDVRPSSSSNSRAAGK